MQKEEVWAKVGHTEKAQQVLGSELIRALDAPLAAHLKDDGAGDHDAKAHPAQALKDRHSLQADLTGAHAPPPFLLDNDAGWVLGIAQGESQFCKCSRMLQVARFLSSVGAMWSTEHPALLLDAVCRSAMT